MRRIQALALAFLVATPIAFPHTPSPPRPPRAPDLSPLHPATPVFPPQQTPLAALVPPASGPALSAVTIRTGPLCFAERGPKVWDAYRNTAAWEFQRFVNIAESGKPHQMEPRSKEKAARYEREDLDASLEYTKKLLNL